MGLMQGKQKMLYLPEAHTDMIYAVVGEETGFLGCAALLAGFVIVLWRGLRLYLHGHDDFGRYLALAVTVCVFTQALINISVVLDLGPTKGIPLPLISYGGSSLLSTLLLLGMLLSVSEHAS
jgi:cell division protein FtsW